MLTHFLKALASGFLEVKTNEYIPDSLTIDNRCVPPGVSVITTSLSALSSRLIASLEFLISSTSHNSLAINQGFPFLLISHTGMRDKNTIALRLAFRSIVERLEDVV